MPAIPEAGPGSTSDAPEQPDSAWLRHARDRFVSDVPGDLGIPQPPNVPFYGDAKEGHGTSRTGIVLPGRWDPPPVTPVGGRRPVIAILDTPIATNHPWLGDGVADGSSWSSASAYTEPNPWPEPDLTFSRPGDGRGSHQGHGTFIAGIVRQLAPGARTLSVPVMNDGGAAETDVVNGALSWLLERVDDARDGEPDLFVDVVNLSFGWYGGPDPTAIDEQRPLLRELAAAGVRVVASAGNRSTDAYVYPAAFATEKTATSLISVGALDPDGRLAAYSNHGDWVLAYAPGTGLVSTVSPIDTPLPWAPPSGVPNPNHEARGFARWGGTSFAAAWVSALLAGHLLDDPYGAGLANLDVTLSHERAAAALAATMADPRVRSKPAHVPR